MCGIVGVFGHPWAASITRCGLSALQHRGQESAGVAVYDGHAIRIHKEMGLVMDALTDDCIAELQGSAAIGHTRYSTTGGSVLCNAQPIDLLTKFGRVAIAHNGNLTNTPELRRALCDRETYYKSSADSEVILHHLDRSDKFALADALIQMLGRVEGAYSLLVLNHDRMIAVRDPYGVRPLVVGEMEGATVFASETCALEMVGASFVAEVAPGELWEVNEGGRQKPIQAFSPTPAPCLFERIYFANPKSILDGNSIEQARTAIGRLLANEAPPPPDSIVVPVPTSAYDYAFGYASASGRPLQFGLKLRPGFNETRSFIASLQSEREHTVFTKLEAVKSIVEGQKVTMIEDSIVRGTNTPRLVRMLREAGATEVHVRIAAPPIRHSCFWGIDIAHREGLIAANRSVEDVRREIGADSLYYGSLDAWQKVRGEKPGTPFCDGCFTGEYHMPLPKDESAYLALVSKESREPVLA